MAPPKSILAEFRHRALKRPWEGDGSSSLASHRSSEPIFTATPDTSVPEVNLSKKQKGKKAAEEKTIVIDPEDPPTSKEKLEYHVMEKEFPYLEFMDRELMVPALLERLEGDDENLAAKFQWAGRMLLKSATLLRYSKPVVTFGVQALSEVKDLKGKLSLLAFPFLR